MFTLISRRQSFILAISLLLCSISFANPIPDKKTKNPKPPEKTKKVFLLGVDGLQYEYLSKLSTPNFRRLNIQKAYTGGILGKSSEQLTSSGPSWATILTGVWSNKHNVEGNYSGLANKDFPSIFQRIAAQHPEADLYSFSAWSPIHQQFFTNDLDLMSAHDHGKGDEKHFQQAKDVLQEKDPSLVFLHLDEVDHAGHRYCFGTEYSQALSRVDEQLGQLLDLIEVRAQTNNEDWLFLLVTDHGRDQKGCGHGEQTISEKTIFIASNKQFSQANIGTTPELDKSALSALYYLPAQTQIAPSILNFLNIESNLLDGNSLFRDHNISKLTTGISKQNLVWESLHSGNIIIKQNGITIGQVNAMQKNYEIEVTPNEVYKNDFLDYELWLNGQVSHLRVDNRSDSEQQIAEAWELLNQTTGFLRFNLLSI